MIHSVEFHSSTEQSSRILDEILPNAIALFLRKNADYNIVGIDIAATLGVRGQWSDMYRKIAKLKQSMWDQSGEGLEFESAEEVIQDLIGHCLLSLLFLKDERLDKSLDKMSKTHDEIMQERMGIDHPPTIQEAIAFRDKLAPQRYTSVKDGEGDEDDF
jgi:hypothetical protein